MNPRTAGGRLRNGAVFAVLMATSSLMALIYSVPAPVLFGVGQEYGAWIAQGMSNLPSVGIIVGGPVAGWMVRHWGTRRVLLPSLALYGITGPLAAIISDPHLLLASRFLLGFAAAGAVAASLAMLTARYDGKARLRLLGIQGGIASASGLLSLKLAGLLAAAAGTWRAPFVLYWFGIVLLVVAIPAFGHETATRPADVPHEAAPPWVIWSLWPLYAVTVLLFAAGFSTGLQLSFKLGEHGIVDPRTQSNVILFAALMNGISSASYGYLLPKLGERPLFTLLIALMAVGALVIGLGQEPFSIGCGAAAMGLGGGLVGPHLIGKLMTRVSDSERAGAVGLFYSCIFIGEFVNPLFMQPLRSALSMDGAFLTLAALLGAGSLCGAALGRSRT